MKKRIAAGIAFAVFAAAVIGVLSYDRSDGGDWNGDEIRVLITTARLRRCSEVSRTMSRCSTPTEAT